MPPKKTVQEDVAAVATPVSAPVLDAPIKGGVAKTPKAKATKVVEESTPSAPTVAPKVDEKPKSTRGRKAKVESAPVVTADVSTEAEVESADDKHDTIENIVEQFKTVVALVKGFGTKLNEYKKLATKYEKVFKNVEKKRELARKNKSGFAKPCRLSDELCAFLSLDKGTELPRTSVTKLLTKYVKDNKLFNTENKRNIIPNAALKKLLNFKDGEKDAEGKEIFLSYFNLQRYLKHQFTPAPVAA